MAHGGMSCIKYIIGVFNLAFFVTSIAIIALCVQAIKMPESVEKILDINNLYLVAAIAASVFLLVLSFMGCCGALRENHCMLVTYGTLLLAIMLVEVGLGVLAVVYRYKVEKIAVTQMEEYIEKYNLKDENSTVNAIIDDLQMSFKCCGANGAGDWLNRTKGPKEIPLSCCGRMAGGNSTSSTTTAPLLSSIFDGNDETCTKEKAFKDGCVVKIRDLIKAHVTPIGAVLLTICLIQLLGVILSCVFAHSIKEGYQVV